MTHTIRNVARGSQEAARLHQERLDAIVERVGKKAGPPGYLYRGVLVAIDPGTEESAWVELTRGEDGEAPRVVRFAKEGNTTVLERLRSGDYPFCDRYVLEMVASYGMAVGAEVFETVYWIGRFAEAIEGAGGSPERMFRREVKMHLCGTAAAKDSNIRQAILDLYPRVGGGAVPQVGTKGRPGPLYGVSGDVWAALGVGITAYEKGRVQE